MSLVLPAGSARNLAGIWMGGARSLRGEPLDAGHLSRGWVIDAAGDVPESHRMSAWRSDFCVFADLEEPPQRLARIVELAEEAAAAARSEGGPAGLFVLCTHGLNRSGLVAGFVLRALGLAGDEAVARIRQARPGALSNSVYEQLVREGARL